MSVENSSSSRSPKNDLGDLQAEYAKKKKRYAQEQEQELKDLKEYYNTRKDEVREQGAAAINHIRKTQSDTVGGAQEARREASARSEAQINGIESDYRRKINETQARRQAQLDETRRNSEEKISSIEQHQEQKIDKIRENANKDIQTVKDKYNKELHSTQEFTGKRLTEIKGNNEAAVKTELERGREVQGKLQENLTKDYETMNSQGQKKIAERHEVQEKQIAHQDADFAKRYEKQRNQWASREQLTNEQYQNRIGQSKEAYEKQLKDQNSRFKSVYEKNDSANRESLKIQSNNLLKEQIELKKKFFRETEKYAGKEDDPFYKLQDRGNRLRENNDFYVVDAYVPTHEKDNIKVTVKADKASISGKRAFKEEVDEEGRRMSTNNYQSFREEFAFDKPVITEGMTRERNGDYLTFFIPKLNSFDTARKLNKKA